MSARDCLAALRERASKHGLEILESAIGGYTLTPAMPGLKRDIISGVDLEAIKEWLDRHRP